ncbi:MAG: metallophosphoesterase [Candidatus Bathyarchaeota archaeon]|nr:metallophosphoesterase [Candidatus Bathyarchaeota archaeon]
MPKLQHIIRLKRHKTVTAVLFSIILAVVALCAPVSAQADSPSDKIWVFPAYDLDDFTVVVLPDTQYYSESYPEIFESQIQWILDNKEALNIVFVSHLGDVVNVWNSVEQWNTANACLSRLDGVVPWGVLPGNHDGISISGDLSFYSQYFGSERFSGYRWYGGAHKTDNGNNYQLFSAGGDDYLVFHLQFDPSEAVLSWANSVISKYPNRRVIVSAHEYMGAHYMPSLTLEIGEVIWNKLVKLNSDQIFLVMSGHLSLEQRRTDTINGYDVHQMVFDYQNRTNGGNGWLRTFRFSPKQDKIFVQTYSPYLDQYENDSESEFVLDYDMTSNQENVTIQSNLDISDFSYITSEHKICFTATTNQDTTGYCNVSIPNSLVDAESWSVTVGDASHLCTVVKNVSNTAIFFSIPHSGSLLVSIEPRSEADYVVLFFVLFICAVVAVVLLARIRRANIE